MFVYLNKLLGLDLVPFVLFFFLKKLKWKSAGLIAWGDDILLLLSSDMRIG